MTRWKMLLLIALTALCVVCAGVVPADENAVLADKNAVLADKNKDTAVSEAPAFSGSGRDIVAEGIRLFEGGDYVTAARAFAEAEVVLPEDLNVAFDRGCAYQAAGDYEKAEGQYNRAALSRDAVLASAARFNLGTVNVQQAMGVFGPQPEAAEPEQREEGLAFLGRAVMHFRDCLEIDPDHEDARHNLEALRLWIKHMRALWEEADRQKQRDELNVLQFLEMIQQQQLMIRGDVKTLLDYPDSPRRREAVSVAESNQRKLIEEIEYLKEKLTEALMPSPSPASGAPQAAPAGNLEEIEKSLNLLHNWADESAQQMTGAADMLAGGSEPGATETQWEAFERLDRIYAAIAPFEAVVRKSVAVEQGLVNRTIDLISAGPEAETAEPAVSEPGADTASANDASMSEAPDASESGTDWEDMALFQDRVTRWAGILPYKVEEAEKHIEQQMNQLGQGSPMPVQPGGDPQQAMQAQQEKLEALRRACEKAREHAPRIEELSREAAMHLLGADGEQALPPEEEALILLKEIAEELPKDDQNQDQGDQKQEDKKDQQDQNQDEQKEQEEDQEQQKQQEQQQPKDRKLTKEELEALLRKAKEKEREHKDKQKQLQEMIGRVEQVEKDW